MDTFTLAPQTVQTKQLGGQLRTLIFLRLLLFHQTLQPATAHVRLQLLDFLPVRLQLLNDLGVVVKGQRVEVRLRVLLFYLLVLRKVLARVLEGIE